MRTATTNEEKVVRACETRDIEGATQLILEGVTFDEVIEAAIYKTGSSKLYLIALSKGLKWDRIFSDGSTPYHHVCRGWQEEREREWSDLLLSVYSHDKSFHNSPKRWMIDQPDNSGIPPLEASLWKMNLVELLLQCHAFPACQFSDGRTFIHHLAEKDQQGGFPDIEVEEVEVDEDREGWE